MKSVGQPSNIEIMPIVSSSKFSKYFITVALLLVESQRG